MFCSCHVLPDAEMQHPLVLLNDIREDARGDISEIQVISLNNGLTPLSLLRRCCLYSAPPTQTEYVLYPAVFSFPAITAIH